MPYSEQKLDIILLYKEISSAKQNIGRLKKRISEHKNYKGDPNDNKKVDSQYDNYLKSISDSKYDDIFIEHIESNFDYDNASVRCRIAYDQLIYGKTPEEQKSAILFPDFIMSPRTDRQKAIEISERYCSRYYIYRYAAHESIAPKSENGKKVHSIIRASLEITACKNDFPDFVIVFRPGGNRTIRVVGKVFQDHEKIFIIGMEKARNVPVIIVGPHDDDDEREIEFFEGLILRKHRITKMMTSRVIFVKSEESFDEMCKKNGRIPEDNIEVSGVVERYGARMLNTIKDGGKSALMEFDEIHDSSDGDQNS